MSQPVSSLHVQLTAPSDAGADASKVRTDSGNRVCSTRHGPLVSGAAWEGSAMHLVTPKTLISTPSLTGACHVTLCVISATDSSSLTCARSSNLTPVGFGGTGTGVDVGLGRGVHAAVGLGRESVGGTLERALAARVRLPLGVDAGAEQAAPMMTIVTIATATGKRERRGLRIRVSFVLIGRGDCDPRPAGQ